MTGIQFRAVGAGAVAAALLGLARFGSKLLKSCNFIPKIVSDTISESVKLSGGGGGGGGGGGASPHTPLAGMLQQHQYRSRRAARPTVNCFLQDLSLQIVCSLGPGSMCNSHDVVPVLTLWCNYNL